MVKLLMTWDIQPGRETAYLEFVSQQFTPGLLRLGLEPTEVWYTYWGEGPQILMGCIAQDSDAMHQLLDSSAWDELHKELDGFVTNFQYKTVPATGRFQL